MITNETKFRPVFTLNQENLENIAKNPGYLYFCEDTGAMFLDIDPYTRISVGGGSGISLYYARQAEVGQDGNDNYIILRDNIVGDDVVLRPDDLIINSDGAFYKVLDINEDDNYMCERIAISGTGGGGGGGGTVVENDVSFTWDKTTISAGMSYIYGKDFYAEFYPIALHDDEVELSFLITQNGKQIEAFTETVDSGTAYRLNMGRLPKGDGISIQVQASSMNMVMTNGPKRTFANISTKELGLTKDSNFNASAVQSGECGIGFLPIANGLNQTLHVIIDNMTELDLNDIQSNKTFLDFRPNGNIYTVKIPQQSHGTHTIKMYLSITISGRQLDSDPITYEVAWKDDADDTPLIWVGNYPSTAIKYNETIIPFMVYDPEKVRYSQKTKVYLVANGIELPTSPMEVGYNAGAWIQWDVTNLLEALSGAGKENVFTLTCGSTTKRVVIRCTTDGARELDLANENALILNLVSTGRSNNETTNSRTNWSYENFNTTFTNFNWYNNGWLNDNDGNGSYLSIANGASARVNLRTIALNGSGTGNYSFEMRFRVRNIQEYSTLIRTIPYYYIMEDNKSHTVDDIKRNGYTYKKDPDGNTIMDKASPKEISSTAGVIFKYLNNDGNGFCIGTQEAYFKTPDSIVNVRYKEDEIINLSFVVSYSNHLLSIYLNGILSGALDLTSTDSFTMDNDCFEINSEFCDIDIYKLRIYKAELSMPEVIKNYISDIHDIDLYDQNQLTDKNDGTILLFSKLEEYNKTIREYNDKIPVDQSANWKPFSMPYAVWEIIDNGNGTDPNAGTHASDDDRLPYFKGNDRYCKITFINPSADYAFDRGILSETMYYNSSPSYIGIGAEINVQGTSSQAYPRRNMKTKFKSCGAKVDAGDNVHEDWGWFYLKGSKGINPETMLPYDETTFAEISKWNMDNSTCATNKFTWKIDYMESSGTYNTGFANLVGNNMYDYHPRQTIPQLDLPKGGFRTSVYGFPVMTFHKHSTPVDKAATEDTEYLTYEYIGRYNMNLDKSSNEYYGFEEKVTHPFTHEEVSNDIAYIAECWELRDNQGTWTSFKYPDAASRADGFGTQTSDGWLEIAKHFEMRYNGDGDAVEAAFDMSVDASLTGVKGYNKRKVDLSTQAKKNAFVREKLKNLEVLFNWLDSTDTSVVPKTDTGVPLEHPVTYETTIYYMVQTFPETQTDPNTGEETIVDIAWYVDADGNKLVRLSEVAPTDVDDRHYFVHEVNGENIMTRAIAPNDYTGVKRAKDDILITYNTDCADYRLKKFVNEFNDHLDLEYCLVYFILTELLLCYDSRGKNMMIATWGPQKDGGDYVWFPIFYDIDTQLGLNNIGAVLWDYDTDATADGTFSTANSVLWTNFFAGFRTAIEAKYRTLRQARLNEKIIEGAYLCDPEVFTNSYAMKGVRPVIALGLDEWYKYIACGVNKQATWYTGTDRRYGFYVSSHDDGNTKTTDASYVYTCQGDRKLSRELFIRNRLNYLDSWWLAGAYNKDTSTYKNEIMIRANANDLATSDKYLDQSKVLEDVTSYTRVAYPKDFYDAVPEFELTPFLAQYVTVFYDEDPLTPTIKYDGVHSVTTHTTPSVENGYRAIHPYNEQLTYIPGGDFLSDLGDLSLKYPSHFKLQTGKRLIQLLVGGDAPGYENGIIGKEAGTFDLNDKANSTNKKGLLQKIVLTGLSALKMGQDVSGSEKLREFRALNTKIPSVTFANGAPLHTVHLPKSSEKVELVHALNLKKLLTEEPVVMIEQNGTYVYNDHDEYEGLYIEGLTDWDKNNSPSENVSILNTIILSDVALGYNSFIVLDNAMDIRERCRPDGYLRLKLEGVEWSPYEVVETDVDYSNSIQFYRLTDHNNFIPYVHSTAQEWNRLKINKKIYTLNNDLMTKYGNLITSTEVLDTIIADYEAATSVANNHYRAAAASDQITLPSITGTIFINNENGTALSEVQLQDTYKRYFPDLNVYAANVNESYVAKFVQDLGGGREEQIDLIRYDKVPNAHATMTSRIPTKTNYDFQGWTLNSAYTVVDKSQVAVLKNQGIILDQAGVEAKEFSASQTDYIFYAVFAITSYEIKFCDPLNTSVILTSYRADFGTFLYDPNILPITDESSLSDTERYKFLGWVDDPSKAFPRNATAAKLIDLTSIMSQNSDRTFYACYILEDCLTNPTDDRYFRYESSSFASDDGTRYNGLLLRPVPGVTLQGKITLPTEHDGQPVIKVDGFSGSTGENITHIYWYGTPHLKQIEISCFQNCLQLKHFDLPETVEVIQNSAFANDENLMMLDFASTQLRKVRDYAFNGALTYGSQNLPVFHLPGSLTFVGQLAFSYMKFLNGIGKLQFGGPGDPTQLTEIQNDGFQNDQTRTQFTDVEFYVDANTDQNRLRSYIGYIGRTGTGTISYPNA